MQTFTPELFQWKNTPISTLIGCNTQFFINSHILGEMYFGKNQESILNRINFSMNYSTDSNQSYSKK